MFRLCGSVVLAESRAPISSASPALGSRRFVRSRQPRWLANWTAGQSLANKEAGRAMEPAELQGDNRDGSQAAVTGSAANLEATKLSIVPLSNTPANW
jgi:hypothetical protein